MEKNLSFSVLLNSNDKKQIDVLSARVEDALLQAQIDTWIYGISISNACVVKFFASHDIDFDFVVDIIKAELGGDYVCTILETFEGKEIDRL